MDYFISLQDKNGYVHSVDNLVITYSINPLFQSDYLDIMIDSIHNLRDKHKNDINYWERLNVNACSKYSWYCNHIHLDDGIYLSIGHYRDGLKEKRCYVVFPLLKLEVNPNKHWGKPVLHDLFSIINKFCIDATLNRYDYAIDIPCKMSDVQVFNTLKEKGLYKGTRYFGQRNKDGFCRIYDKTKESNLDIDLTRVEHTFSLVKHTKKKSFTTISILQHNAKESTQELTSNDLVILNLCKRLHQAGLEFEDILSKLNKVKRKKIYENLNGNYIELEFDEKLHDELLELVMDKFNIKQIESEEEPEETGDDNFVFLDENASLPWEE